MTIPQAPLEGVDLVSCASANAKYGLEEATRLSGYETHVQDFQKNLRKACEDMGVEITHLHDLIRYEETDQNVVNQFLRHAEAKQSTPQ